MSIHFESNLGEYPILGIKSIISHIHIFSVHLLCILCSCKLQASSFIHPIDYCYVFISIQASFIANINLQNSSPLERAQSSSSSSGCRFMACNNPQPFRSGCERRMLYRFKLDKRLSTITFCVLSRSGFNPAKGETKYLYLSKTISRRLSRSGCKRVFISPLIELTSLL